MSTATPSASDRILVASDAPLLGEAPTFEQLEQVQWAEETLRNAPALLREHLRQLVTLNTALLAGLAAFFDKLPMPHVMKVLAAVCLLLSLLAALWGALPREAQVCPFAPESIKRVRESNVSARLRCLKWASSLLFFGIVSFVVGILV